MNRVDVSGCGPGSVVVLVDGSDVVVTVVEAGGATVLAMVSELAHPAAVTRTSTNRPALVTGRRRCDIWS